MISFSFKLFSKFPVLDLAPHHARMTSCFHDLNGKWHLLTDVIDASQKTQASWSAEIWYFTSTDFLHWDFVSGAIHQGAKTLDWDADGAASPSVLATPTEIFLFYAGRRIFPAGAKMCPQCRPGVPGYISSQILLARAPANSGAPTGPFRKFGKVVPRGIDWDSARLDDPSAVLKDGQIHLFFKGFQIADVWDSGKIQVGAATSSFSEINFTKNPKPVFSVPGGGEMPRVFFFRDEWHLFYRFFKPHLTLGTTWQHFTATDGFSWKLMNRELFNCVTPGQGAADMAPVLGMNGTLAEPPLALATGEENGILKIWAYEMEITKAD